MTGRAAVLITVACLLVITGCRTATMYNATDVPLASHSSSRVTLADVTKAILAAGKRKGWVMEVARSGEVVATLTVKRYVAAVTVTYDTSRFSITYRDSSNLMHSGDEIHRRYNSWVRHLEETIQDEVKSVAAATLGSRERHSPPRRYDTALGAPDSRPPSDYPPIQRRKTKDVLTPPNAKLLLMA